MFGKRNLEKKKWRDSYIPLKNISLPMDCFIGWNMEYISDWEQTLSSDKTYAEHFRLTKEAYKIIIFEDSREHTVLLRVFNEETLIADVGFNTCIYIDKKLFAANLVKRLGFFQNTFQLGKPPTLDELDAYIDFLKVNHII